MSNISGQEYFDTIKAALIVALDDSKNISENRQKLLAAEFARCIESCYTRTNGICLIAAQMVLGTYCGEEVA